MWLALLVAACLLVVGASLNVTDGAGLLRAALSRDKQAYYAVIKAGGIYFRVALDTSSADLWLTSSACGTPSCHGVPSYPVSYRSPSFIPINNNSTVFNVSYVDGTSASGFVAREKVEFSRLSVDGQAFGLVNASTVALNEQMSGILGLGFPRLSTIYHAVANATPFFSTLAQSGKLDYPLFALSLRRNATGSITLGAIDASVVSNVSNIDWYPVTPFRPFGSENNVSSYLHWVTTLSGISVNGSKINLIPTYSNVANASLALLDIGTPGIHGPYQDVSRIFAMFPGSRLVDPNGRWVVPCDTNHTIEFTFSEKSYGLLPSDYLIGPAAGNPNLCLAWPQADPPSPDGIDWQLGTAFLRTVYSIFSYGIDTKEPPFIGLYTLRNSSAPVPLIDMPSFVFSSASETVATTLPNFPIQTPTPTTPAYAFNTSVQAFAGQIVGSELATSTYSPAFGTSRSHATSLPTISPEPTVVTLLLTDSSGSVLTSMSTIPDPSVTLGRPPGSSGDTRVRASGYWTIISCIFLALLTFIL